MIYFITLGIAVVGAMIWPRGSQMIKNNWWRVSKYDFLYSILLLLTFLTFAFRARSIGVDTRVYLDKYQKIAAAQSYSAFGGMGSIEPLFYYLNKVLALLFGNANRCLLIVQGILFVRLYCVIIREYSIDPFVSFIAMMAFGIYTGSLCLLRQSVGLSLCALSITYIVKNEPWRFLVCILAAVFFHYTSVFFLLAFFVANKMGTSTKETVLFTLVAVLAFLFVERIQSFAAGMFDRWDHYASVESGAQGFVSFTVYLLITIFAIMEKSTIIATNPMIGKLAYNLNFLYMILWVMRLVTRNAERLSYNFAIAPILLVPMICNALSTRYGENVGKLARFIIIICMCYMFYNRCVKDASYYPFVWNFDMNT